MNEIPNVPYLSEDHIGKIKESNSKYTNGYFILFDIINSTSRKNNEHNWVEQTETVYEAFSRFCETLNNESEEFELMTKKFLGDGMMAYFQTSQKRTSSKDTTPPSDLSKFFVLRVISFLLFIQDMKDYLSGLSLKSVLTYLTNIRIVHGEEDSMNDVLGRGIDFSFRLEKFADSGHTVINKMLAYSIMQDEEILSPLEKMGYDLIPCCKKVKGWDSDGEEFYLLIKFEHLEDAYRQKIPSKNEENVYLELFQWYIKNKISTVNIIDNIGGNPWSVDKKGGENV